MVLIDVAPSTSTNRPKLLFKPMSKLWHGALRVGGKLGSDFSNFKIN
jgi:hypothetical protein